MSAVEPPHLPTNITNQTIYKQVRRFARLSDNDPISDEDAEAESKVEKTAPLCKGGWAWGYRCVFENHHDRRAVIFLTFVSALALVVGVAQNVNRWVWTKAYFAEDGPIGAWGIGIAFYLALASMLAPALAVWLGRKVVIWAKEEINIKTADLKLAMKEQVADAGLRPDAPQPIH